MTNLFLLFTCSVLSRFVRAAMAFVGSAKMMLTGVHNDDDDDT